MQPLDRYVPNTRHAAGNTADANPSFGTGGRDGKSRVL